jgi:Zn-dependent protease with chaperone function
MFASSSAFAGGSLVLRAQIQISADETGVAAIEYRVTLDSELSVEQKAAIKSATGLMFTKVIDPVTTGSSHPTQVVYWAHQPMQLSRDGLAFSGDLQIAPLAERLAQVGVSEIEVSIAVPADIEGRVLGINWKPRQPPPPEKRSFSIPIAGAHDQLAPIRIAYGDRGPSGRGRFVLLTLLSLVPPFVVIYVLSGPAGRPGHKLPYYTRLLRRSRYELLVSLGLPVYWNAVIAMLDIQRAVSYSHAFEPVSTRIVAGLLWQIGPPLPLFVLCELIWLGKRRELGAVTTVGQSGPGERFLACLGGLFACGFLGLPFSPRPLLPLFYLACLLGGILSLVLRAVPIDRSKARDDQRRARYQMDQWLLRSKIERLVAIFDVAKSVASKWPTKIDGILTAPQSAVVFDPCPSDWLEEKFIVLPRELIDKLPDSQAEAIASHQLTHLTAQPAKSWGKVLGIGILIGAGFGGLAGYRISIPLVAVATWSAFLHYRRKLEFQADHDAVRVTQNPEAVIASILLLAQEGFLPSDSAPWRERKLWVPITSERVRRVARESGIPAERIDNLGTGLSGEYKPRVARIGD